MNTEHRTCQERGCSNTAIECTPFLAREDERDWYCPEHCAENGYCPACGYFCADLDQDGCQYDLHRWLAIRWYWRH
jgi:hypothetical protein